MHVVDVDPDDAGQVERLARLDEKAREHDDPEAFVQTVEDHTTELRHGGDLNPGRASLLLDDTGEVVGSFAVDVPVLDNRHLVEAHLRVRPDRRDEGLQAFLLEELVARTRALGRSTLWVGVGVTDARMTALLTERGLALGSQEARRHQVLADVDATETDRLERDAAGRARARRPARTGRPAVRRHAPGRAGPRDGRHERRTDG